MSVPMIVSVCRGLRWKKNERFERSSMYKFDLDWEVEFQTSIL